MKNLLADTARTIDSQPSTTLAAYALFAFVALCILCSIVNGLAKLNRPAPRPTRATTSLRKSPRTTVEGDAR